MRHSLTVDAFIQRLKSKLLTDQRIGQNVQYAVNDAAQAAFAIFFMQSASFLAGQRQLRQRKGKSNAETVFKMERIPTDTHIRNMLDPVHPAELSDEFRFLLDELADSGYLKEWRVLDRRLAFSLDGVYYFSSQKISCPECQHRELAEGKILYTHSAITPVLVAPGYAHVLPAVPEFIIPQDGAEKQDCEVNAAKRWVGREQATLRRYRAILLGDDLYSRQPLCAESADQRRGLHLCLPSRLPSGALRPGRCGDQLGSSADPDSAPLEWPARRNLDLSLSPRTAAAR